MTAAPMFDTVPSKPIRPDDLFAVIEEVLAKDHAAVVR
jgi:hypothetical protein